MSEIYHFATARVELSLGEPSYAPGRVPRMNAPRIFHVAYLASRAFARLSRVSYLPKSSRNYDNLSALVELMFTP